MSPDTNEKAQITEGTPFPQPPDFICASFSTSEPREYVGPISSPPDSCLYDILSLHVCTDHLILESLEIAVLIPTTSPICYEGQKRMYEGALENYVKI